VSRQLFNKRGKKVLFLLNSLEAYAKIKREDKSFLLGRMITAAAGLNLGISGACQ
jgi:hypothetical protein